MKHFNENYSYAILIFGVLMKTDEQIFKEYDNKLYCYIKLIYPDLTRLISKERAPYVKQIDALSDLYYFMDYLLNNDEEFFKGENTKGLMLFYTKAAADIISIRQCLLVGQLSSAASLERNLLETYIYLLLILEKDTENRLVLFDEYQKVQIWLHYKDKKEYLAQLKEGNDQALYDYEKTSFLEDYPIEVIEKIEDEYSAVKFNYHPKNPLHWAWMLFKDDNPSKNPTLKSICKYLKKYPDYLRIYSTNSLVVHNQPLMVNFQLRNNKLYFGPIYNEMIANITGISMSYCKEIIINILKYLKFNKVNEIEIYLKMLFYNNFMN